MKQDQSNNGDNSNNSNSNSNNVCYNHNNNKRYKTKAHSRFNTARGFLIFWCLFIGIGAVGGAAAMLIAPDGSILGMNGMLPFFQVLPFADVLFQNYIFPGISLLCVNGITNLVAAALLFAHKKAGIICGGIFGVTLMAWITIQFVIFPPNFMSTIYFIFGILQALTGYAAYVFYRQENFAFDLDSYQNIGTNPRELVVYFSRMGYTKKQAYETANQTGAQLCQLKATEPTDGTLGFWWCGRYGMHGWNMPIEKHGLDLASYDKVTICAPIWVFGLAGPMKSFCQDAKGKIKRADYILVHHMNSSFTSVADEMDDLLGIKHEQFKSIRCRMGNCKIVNVKQLQEIVSGK